MDCSGDGDRKECRQGEGDEAGWMEESDSGRGAGSGCGIDFGRGDGEVVGAVGGCEKRGRAGGVHGAGGCGRAVRAAGVGAAGDLLGEGCRCCSL